MKSKSAITLVALIITIIVLLILATVSISLVINNGILDKAQQGVDKNSEEEELEQIKLAVASAMLKGNGFLDTDNLNSELHERIDENENAEKNGTNWNYKGYLIDKNGNVVKYDKLLPKEYQQVEYIESTGTQYIDTKIVANSTMKIDLKCKCLGSSFVFGSRSSSSYEYSGLTFEYNDPINVRWGNSVLLTDNKYVVNQDYIVHIENGNSSINNNSSQASYGNNFFYGNIYIFAINNNSTSSSISSSQYGRNRIYYFKIYEGNSIIRDFIPCCSTTTVVDVDGKECPTGTVGLYDIVNDMFYTNQGDGVFLKERKKDFENVEYIESTGTQYIDTKIVANSTMKIDLKCKCLGSSFVFGSRSSSSYEYSGLTFEYNDPINVRWGNSVLLTDNKYVVNQDYIVHIENGNSSINNNSSQASYGNNFFYGNIYIFAINNNSTSSSISSSQYGRNRIYYFKIYEGNSIIRDFIPCCSTTTVVDVDGKECPTGTVGLYDIVNDMFYTNQGSGDDFIAGPNV